MEYRIGTCSQCGAEFKVPASFRHNVARCKVCEGVVRFDGPTASAPPEPTPIPARKVAPPTPPQPSRGETPSEPPKKKGGTLERLRAERAAQARAEAQAKAQAQPKPAARTSAAPKPKVSPTRASASRSSRSSKDKAEVSESPGKRKSSSSRSRRGSGSSRRSSREKKKKSPVPMLALGLVLVGGAAAFFFKDALFGDGEPEEVQAQTAPSDEPVEPEVVTPDETNEEGAPPETDPEAMADDEPEPEKEPEKPAIDPSSVDLSELADFGPVDDTTDEEWAEMNGWMETWMDPNAGAAGNRSRNKLVAMDRKAWPVMLNYMKTLDFSTEDGFRNGDLCQRALMDMVNGNNFGWEYSTEPKGELFNKKVVKAWYTQWERSFDNIEYWIKFAKLEEKDPERAAELREQFGGEGSSTPDILDDTDDLDVD